MRNTFGKVVAVKFIAKGTIEEKILKMQERKAQFARDTGHGRWGGVFEGQAGGLLG